MFQVPVNRVQPRMLPQSYKTYAIAAPLQTHFRDATCAEVECPAYVHGWQTIVDERTELGMAQAYTIRRMSGRQYREERNEQGLTVFTFPPGQNCFAGGHKKQLERPALYLVGNGDHRMFSPRQAHRLRPEQWRDDFGEHQQRLHDRFKRG